MTGERVFWRWIVSIGVQVALVGSLLGPGLGHARAPSGHEDTVERTTRQVNTLLAEHPWFVAPLGLLVTTLEVDGARLIAADYYPESDRYGLWWMTDIHDVRPEVKVHELYSLPDEYLIQCRAIGPLRAKRNGRCWTFEDTGRGPHPDGRVWFAAEPEIAEMIRAAIEDLIVLIQQREQATR